MVLLKNSSPAVNLFLNIVCLPFDDKEYDSRLSIINLSEIRKPYKFNYFIRFCKEDIYTFIDYPYKLLYLFNRRHFICFI
jgi:hypothetical protein